MGYDVLVILVVVKWLMDLWQGYEHGRYHLLGMAGAPVHQPRYWKIPVGACVGVSGCQPCPGWIRHS